MSATPCEVIVISRTRSVQDAVADMASSAGLPARRIESCQQFIDSYDPAWAGCIVLDINIPGPDGLKLQHHRTKSQCELPVVFLSAEGDGLGAVQSLLGAEFVRYETLRTGGDLAACLLEAVAWYRQFCELKQREAAITVRYNTLTPREKEVMREMVHGASVKSTGIKLGLSARTVEIYRGRVFSKMAAASVADLVRLSLVIKP